MWPTLARVAAGKKVFLQENIQIILGYFFSLNSLSRTVSNNQCHENDGKSFMFAFQAKDK